MAAKRHGYGVTLQRTKLDLSAGGNQEIIPASSTADIEVYRVAGRGGVSVDLKAGTTSLTGVMPFPAAATSDNIPFDGPCVGDLPWFVIPAGGGNFRADIGTNGSLKGVCVWAYRPVSTA